MRVTKYAESSTTQAAAQHIFSIDFAAAAGCCSIFRSASAVSAVICAEQVQVLSAVVLDDAVEASTHCSQSTHQHPNARAACTARIASGAGAAYALWGERGAGASPHAQAPPPHERTRQGDGGAGWRTIWWYRSEIKSRACCPYLSSMVKCDLLADQCYCMRQLDVWSECLLNTLVYR